MAAWAGWPRRETVPVAFTNVRVGLNPVAEDPWSRDLQSWEPRYGFFVESVEKR